jgi:hypothetical protein
MARILTILILLLLSSCTDQEQVMHEASMNFDLENVAPFLTRINIRYNLNLPVDELVKMTHQTKIESEQSRTIQVTFNGLQTQLEYRVFMDDIDAPDLYFFTPSKDLAEAIEDQLEAFADELGI